MEGFILFEGMLQVPQKMYERCFDVVVSEVLGCVDHLLKGVRKKHPQHAKMFREAVNKYKVEPADYTGSGKFYEIPYETDGLPDKVKSAFKSNKPNLVLFIDWRGSVLSDNVLGGYFDVDKNGNPAEVLAINPRETLRYLRNDPQDVYYFINKVGSDLKHEMMHMVQKRALQYLNKNQAEMKPDYHSHGKDYFNSFIEFYPQIDSAVFDFKNLLSLLKPKDKDTINSWAKIYVGAKKPAYLAGVQPNKFFMYIKDDKKLYEKAVKVFYSLLGV